VSNETRNPAEETPQQRYARLHRAIENGTPTDGLWRELAEASFAIGHVDEANRCVAAIANDDVRRLVARRLASPGLAPFTTAGNPPAAAGPADGAPTLRDHVVDAFQYLFHQHMPLLVLVAVLSFPVIVGVGGFLTAGSSPLLLAGIAATPGLCILTVVGGMGREILRASAEGIGDVPPAPAFHDLLRAAAAFFVDATVVLTALVGAPVAAIYLGAPLALSLPWLAVGALVAPMAWSLRQFRADFACLEPTTLLRAIWRTRDGYLGLAGATAGLFLPAALVAWKAFGMPLWAQIAAIGPFCVLPLFVASRLIGTWLDARRAAVADLLTVAAKPGAKARPQALPAADEVAAPRAPARPVAAPSSLRAPRALVPTVAARGNPSAARAGRRAVLAADGSLTFQDAPVAAH
jgi:hypothetical protein